MVFADSTLISMAALKPEDINSLRQIKGGGAQGQASDIEIQAQEIIRMKEMLNDILTHHTSQPLKRIKKDTDRDFFMSSKEAKDYGLIDEVVQRKAVDAKSNEE
jgi:ATP-dependent Clp endopeptidase proteolytic subunit ClpP